MRQLNVNRIFTLSLLLTACNSTQETVQQPPVVDIAPVQVQVPRPDPKVREWEAKQMLEQAGNEENDCSKGTTYQLILADYPDTRSAKFAKRWLQSFNKKQWALSRKMRATIRTEKFTDGDLTELLAIIDGSLITCPAATERAEADIKFLTKYREKHYGY